MACFGTLPAGREVQALAVPAKAEVGRPTAARLEAMPPKRRA